MIDNHQFYGPSYQDLLRSLYRTMYGREAPEDQIRYNFDQIVSHKVDLDSIIYSFSNSPERLEFERNRALNNINSEIYNLNDLIPSKDIILFDGNRQVNDLGRSKLGSKYDLLHKIKSIAYTGIFLDVGANIGQTMIEAFAFDRSIQYFGFEPNPAAFRYLNAVAAANALDATLFPWACSDAARPLKLYTFGALDTAATTRPEIRSNLYNEGNGHWIASYPIDLIAGALELKDNFVLKIDVEGAEFNVIAGARSTIEKYRPILICEVLNAHSEDEIAINDENKFRIENFCNQLDYDIYQQIFAPDDFYGDGNLLGLQRLTEIAKSRLYIDYRTANDYVFVPKELGDISFNA